jgi:thioesterase-3
MLKKLKAQIKVRSYEIDLYGHVNNATYLNYLEHGRVQTLEQTGKSFQQYMDENIFIVIAKINISYLKPTFLDDELDITTTIKSVGRTSVVLNQEIFNRARKENTVQADVTVVFLNQKKRPIPVPSQFLEQLGYKRTIST